MKELREEQCYARPNYTTPNNKIRVGDRRQRRGNDGPKG
jgi:hypothetical protein